MHTTTFLVTLLTLSLAQAASISPDARCGPSFGGTTCLGSTFGSCCSQYGFCGSSDLYCSTDSGCQSQYGNCNTAAATPAASATIATASSAVGSVSQDARCGSDGNGQTCKGSAFGNCCSTSGWCGSTDDYCGVSNCQSGFGDCTSSSSSKTNPVAASSAQAASATSKPASVKPSSTMATVAKASSATLKTSAAPSKASSAASKPASSAPAASASAKAVTTDSVLSLLCNVRGTAQQGISSYKSETNLSLNDCTSRCAADITCQSTSFSFLTAASGKSIHHCYYYGQGISVAALLSDAGNTVWSAKGCPAVAS